MLSLFGGKMPHNVGIVPGGVTEKPTEDKITNFLWRLNEIRDFIENVYIPDVIAVAKTYDDYFGIGQGCKRLLSYGGFDLPAGKLFESGVVNPDLGLEKFAKENITEDVKYSWYADSSSGRNPAEGDTEAQLKKQQAYSFLKSPRYNAQVCEVGPLARMVNNYVQNDDRTKELVDGVLGEFGAGVDALYSVLGRHAARAVEAKLVGDAMVDWLQALKPDEPTVVENEIPDDGVGAGLSEAPRGSVGHWMTVKEKKIERYQVIAPTAWNASPKDDKDQPGPIEQAITGTKIKDKENPFELVRIVRAFDPCLACSVHLLDGKRHEFGVLQVV
jgi:hydrogenase large subunit